MTYSPEEVVKHRDRARDEWAKAIGRLLLAFGDMETYVDDILTALSAPSSSRPNGRRPTLSSRLADAISKVPPAFPQAQQLLAVLNRLKDDSQRIRNPFAHNSPRLHLPWSLNTGQLSFIDAGVVDFDGVTHTLDDVKGKAVEADSLADQLRALRTAMIQFLRQ